MNIKSRALLTTVGIGVVLQGILVLLSIGLAAVTLASVSGAGGGDNSGLLAIAGLASVFGVVSCICALMFDAGAGALYAYMHSRQSALTVADGALGGAASSALVRVVTTLCSLCGTIGVTLAMSGSASGGGGAVVSSLLSGSVSMCIGILAGAILGAIGGAIGGAVLRSQTPAV